MVCKWIEPLRGGFLMVFSAMETLNKFEIGEIQNKKTKKRITKERARLFLQSIVEAEETKHPSVSCGHDYRYEGTQVIASALVGGKELIHLTAFSIDQSSSLSKKTKRRLTRYRNKMELRRFNNK
jgi:hypothetical protein